MTTVLGRPCRYCVANWADASKLTSPVVPEPVDCEMTHRDDARVYDLAHAMAAVFQRRDPSDAQISYFLADADSVVDDFDPAPDRWRVRKLPHSEYYADLDVEVRMRINDVTYLSLEGGHKEQGKTVSLARWRSWQTEGE